MIKQSEIDEAAFGFTESLNFSHNSMETKTMANRLDSCFKTGVEFAELKLQDLAIEFAKHLFSMSITQKKLMTIEKTYIPKEFKLMQGELTANGKELFELFLKQRNGL